MEKEAKEREAKERKMKAPFKRRIKIRDDEPFFVMANHNGHCEVESGCSDEELVTFGKYALMHILDTLIENNSKPELHPAEIASTTTVAIVRDTLAALEEKYGDVGPQQFLN